MDITVLATRSGHLFQLVLLPNHVVLDKPAQDSAEKSMESQSLLKRHVAVDAGLDAVGIIGYPSLGGCFSNAAFR
jgi:hypothetical protein